MLAKKKMDYKMIIEQLKDKNSSLEEVLENTAKSQVIEVKEMEKRVETRVEKIVL